MKRNIINTDVLSTYLSEHRGTIALLNLIIQLLEQIRDWLENGKRQCASQPFTLEDYKHLNLTDEQIRKAIVQLRKDGKLNKKRYWLAVQKVLIAIGIIKGDSKPYERTQEYLCMLFADDPDFDFKGMPNSLSKKCGKGGERFAEDLSAWLTSKCPKQYGPYLEVAKQFLALLKEG